MKKIIYLTNRFRHLDPNDFFDESKVKIVLFNRKKENWDLEMQKEMYEEIRMLKPDGIFNGYTPSKFFFFKKEFFENYFSQNLKCIAIHAAGGDTVDLEMAKKHKVTVSNVQLHENAKSTSEITFYHILATLRKVQCSMETLKKGKWKRKECLGTNLYGKKLGIIGMGKIGSEVAKKAVAFGMKVIYNKRNQLSEEEEEKLGVKFAEFNSLLKEADVISINCPLTQSTKHLFTEKEFKIMKKTAILINTARGPIVKEEDLIKSLKDKEIAGAGLDVFETEPITKERMETFLQLKNVVLTPHMGTHALETRYEMEKRCALNLKRVVEQGIEPLNKLV